MWFRVFLKLFKLKKQCCLTYKLITSFLLIPSEKNVSKTKSQSWKIFEFKNVLDKKMHFKILLSQGENLTLFMFISIEKKKGFKIRREERNIFSN
jgi:hypothetical protein